MFTSLRRAGTVPFPVIAGSPTSVRIGTTWGFKELQCLDPTPSNCGKWSEARPGRQESLQRGFPGDLHTYGPKLACPSRGRGLDDAGRLHLLEPTTL